MLNTKEYELNGKKVYITQLPMRKAVSMLARLFKVVAPGLAATLGETGDIDLSKLGEQLNLKEIITTLANDLDEKKVVDLILDLVKHAVVVENISVKCEQTFDLAFDSNFQLLFSVIKEVLKLNYGSFFPQEDTLSQ